MFYIKESDKSFEQASADLETAVKNHGFGVLHIHDIGAILRSKGFEFGEECRVFEVCNPGQANKILSIDMRMNMALPCRISVYTENGKSKIGLIKPDPMFATLTDDSSIAGIASEVEKDTIKMVDEAR
ncbi:MAG: DUF302 domain-containing protein [Cyclonatronaceae bacterium]